MKALLHRVIALERERGGLSGGILELGGTMTEAEWLETVPALQAKLVASLSETVTRPPIANAVPPDAESELRPNWAGRFYGPRERRPKIYGRLA